MNLRVCVASLALLCLGCDPKSPGGDDETPSSDAWFAMGQGETGWNEVQQGDELLMVLGGQGLLMFPMPIHAGGFSLPDDPKDWTDPNIPVLDIQLDIEGFNIGFGGHFSRVANYPVPFDILDDGTYEFVYITIFVPDELANPCDIHGLPGQIHAELETSDGDLLVWDRDVVIEVPSDLCGI